MNFNHKHNSYKLLFLLFVFNYIGLVHADSGNHVQYNGRTFEFGYDGHLQADNSIVNGPVYGNLIGSNNKVNGMVHGNVVGNNNIVRNGNSGEYSRCEIIGNIVGNNNNIMCNVNGNVIGNNNKVIGLIAGSIVGSNNNIKGQVYTIIDGYNNVIDQDNENSVKSSVKNSVDDEYRRTAKTYVTTADNVVVTSDKGEIARQASIYVVPSNGISPRTRDTFNGYRHKSYEQIISEYGDNWYGNDFLVEDGNQGVLYSKDINCNISISYRSATKTTIHNRVATSFPKQSSIVVARFSMCSLH